MVPARRTAASWSHGPGRSPRSGPQTSPFGGTGEQADRPWARHQRAHRQGAPGPGVPAGRRGRPRQRRALGPRPPRPCSQVP